MGTAFRRPVPANLEAHKLASVQARKHATICHIDKTKMQHSQRTANREEHKLLTGSNIWDILG